MGRIEGCVSMRGRELGTRSVVMLPLQVNKNIVSNNNDLFTITINVNSNQSKALKYRP